MEIRVSLENKVKEDSQVCLECPAHRVILVLKETEVILVILAYRVSAEKVLEVRLVHRVNWVREEKQEN